MIDLRSLHGQSFFVLGLGLSGRATADALKASGVACRAWDDKEETRASFAHPDLLADPAQTDFSAYSAIVLAPGIAASHPQAVRAGLPVISDVDLLARVKPHIPFVGITGTNGKSTTTALIGHILGVAAGGNLGTAALAMDDDASHYVLELSSYQLERSPHLACDVAVHLNITPDHLERHGDLAGYAAAKENLFRHAKGVRTAIIGVDDEPSRLMAARVKTSGQWTLFPLRVGGMEISGYSVVDGILSGPDGKTRMDLRTHDRLKGAHNWQNMAAAWAAAEALGVAPEVIRERILSFGGLPHRQYLVRRIGDVIYINDSKATNADAAEKALLAYEDVYWIIGGLSKTGGLNGLEGYMKKIRRAYLIGQAADEFALWLRAHEVPHTPCGTLEAAVAAAHCDAQAGGTGTVLLSPACASWDQFKSFEHRGQVFESLVQALPARMAA